MDLDAIIDPAGKVIGSTGDTLVSGCTDIVQTLDDRRERYPTSGRAALTAYATNGTPAVWTRAHLRAADVPADGRLATVYGDRIASSLTIVYGLDVTSSRASSRSCSWRRSAGMPAQRRRRHEPLHRHRRLDFGQDIEWLWAEGITGAVADHRTAPIARSAATRWRASSFGCSNSRGEDIDAFTDDDGTTHEQDINRLAASGITVGCTETTFCPNAPVRRDQMASFLVRAIPLTAGAGDDYFRDDNGTTHEADIDRTAAAGITTGCGTWRYCPASSVTRGQMAGFLHRVEKPISPPPHPAPAIATLYVTTTGTDGGNPCLVKADPCRTIAYALSLVLDFDTIRSAPGRSSRAARAQARPDDHR